MLFIKILLLSLLLVFSSSVLADPKMDLGLDVYNNKAQCGVCHTLQAAGSKGQIGPNLDELKPQVPQIIYELRTLMRLRLQETLTFNWRKDGYCNKN